MKWLLIVFFLCTFCTQSRAQLLDEELNIYKSTICESLKKFNEVDSLRNCKDILNLTYSRQLILPINSTNLKYYELGLTVSHGHKYVAILNNKKLKIFKSKNFSEDYLELVKPLEKATSKASVNKLIYFLNNLKSMYDYNNNPPWKRE